MQFKIGKHLNFSKERLIEEFKEKKSAIIVITLMVAMVVSTTLISATQTASAAAADCWDIMIGKHVFATVKTPEEANSIVKGVKNYYVAEGAEVISIKTDPVIIAVPHSYKDNKKPKILKNTQAIIDKIIAGNVITDVHVVKAGDTMWDIAVAKGISVLALRDMNPELNWENIHIGDKIKYTRIEPIINITTEQKVTSVQNVPFAVVKEQSADMYVGESKVKVAGVNGSKKVTEQEVTVNGSRVSATELASEVIKAPVNQVVIEGTKQRAHRVSYNSYVSYNSPSGVTYHGNGGSIISYASKFLGNPYVYGGTSLTNGADCSGFIYRVYNNCGIGIPRVGQSHIGRSVPYSQAKPGDIIIYPGHVSLYAGGGREIHAVNERVGIATTRVGYVGPVLDIRRVVE